MTQEKSAPDGADSPSSFIASFFGSYTDAPIFLTSLPNADAKGREGGPRETLTRDRAVIDRFVEKHDRADRGLYFSVGSIRDDAVPEKSGGSRRSKGNVADIVCAHADVDQKDVTASKAEIAAAVQALPLPPSVVVDSGRGVHTYWLLSESLVATSENIARIEALNDRLAEILCGDSVRDVCRLMRLPGSHNTKEGGMLPVRVVSARFEPRYEIEDLEAMVAEVAPILTRRPGRVGAVGGSAARAAPIEVNPFLRLAAAVGYKPPLDVVAALDAMGEGNIHNTMLSVSASLLAKGEDVERVVEVLMPAIARANGAKWNDRAAVADERKLRGMCADWVRKHPEPVERQEAGEDESHSSEEMSNSDEEQRRPAAQAKRTASGDVVVSLAEARSQREKKKQREPRGDTKIAFGHVIADGVIETVREGGGDMALSDGELWMYAEGVWAAMTPGDEQWLRTLIQTGCETLGCESSTSIPNAAWKRLTEHPDLYHRTIPWDQGTVIATANGLLDVGTRAFGPYRADAWCRSKIGAVYEPGAACPTFLAYLESAFKDRGDGDRRDIIATLQEYFGSILAVRLMTREQRKALFLLGPSRTGKTVFSTIARRIIGDPIAAPSVVDVSGDFGLQQLYGARAWIRDDAVSEADKIEPARFKALVTGEAVSVNRKGKAQVSVSFNIPILLTTNAMPRARDASDAIYNRSLVVEMLNVVEEHETTAARLALGLPGVCDVAEIIVEREIAGILCWALDGLDRLRERGRFDPPASMNAAMQRFKSDNNPVAAWVASSLIRDPDAKVARNDLRCSFNGWQREEMGDEAKAWGGRSLFPQMRPLIPWANMDGLQGHDGERFVTGVRLSRMGLKYWTEHNLEPLRNGSKGYSIREDDVNRVHAVEAPERSVAAPHEPEF